MGADVKADEDASNTPRSGLLRLEAHWSIPPAMRPARPSLVVLYGSRRLRLAPLPGSTDARSSGQWRAGFAVPQDALSARVAFLLNGGELGLLARLPAPARGNSGRGRPGPRSRRILIVGHGSGRGSPGRPVRAALLRRSFEARALGRWPRWIRARRRCSRWRAAAAWTPCSPRTPSPTARGWRWSAGCGQAQAMRTSAATSLSSSSAATTPTSSRSGRTTQELTWWWPSRSTWMCFTTSCWRSAEEPLTTSRPTRRVTSRVAPRGKAGDPADDVETGRAVRGRRVRGLLRPAGAHVPARRLVVAGLADHRALRRRDRLPRDGGRDAVRDRCRPAAAQGDAVARGRAAARTPSR